MENIHQLIRSTRGKWFRVEFTKRDGSHRTMVCRTGVAKYVNGRGLAFDPEEKGLQVVFEPAKKSYRMIPLARLLSFRCGKVQWSDA